MRNPAMPGRVRVIPMLCANDDTLALLRVQVLVEHHRIEPGFAALVANLAFGGKRHD